MQVKPGADTTGKFSFDDQAMPRAYDERLVPVMFEPWAARLVETMGRGRGRRSKTQVPPGPGPGLASFRRREASTAFGDRCYLRRMSSTLGRIPPGKIRLTYEDDRDLPDRSILAIPFADLRD